MDAKYNWIIDNSGIRMAINVGIDTLVGAVQAARNLHPQAAGLLLGAARDAFSTGLHVAAWVAAAVLAVDKQSTQGS